MGKMRGKKPWFTKHLGPWTVGRYLGGGGNGSVWKATRTDSSIAGALKILHLKYQKAGAVRFKRFRDEIQLQNSLAGRPGILPMLDSSLPEKPSASDPAWLVTAQATPIKKALGSCVKLPDVVEAVAAIADTLASLHADCISHRDIKPTNLYRYNGSWVISDFGLADFPGKEELTRSGEQVGPFEYIAPEMRTRAKSADPMKADVYSLGKTLWVLATGGEPHAGEQPKDHLQHAIRILAPHPRAELLDELVDRMVRTDPLERPTMATVAAELHAWLSAVPDPMIPVDLSGILAEINAVLEPSLQTERLRNGYIQSAKRAIEHLAERLQPIGQVFARIPGSNGDLSSEPASLLHTPLDGRRLVWEGSRAWIAPPADACQVMLWSGMRLRLYERERGKFDGQLQLIAEHVVSVRAGPCVVWREERWVPVGSAQQDQAIAELVNALTENLQLAMFNYRVLLQTGGPGYPQPFPQPLP
jgi:serine/threonine protein kinase